MIDAGASFTLAGANTLGADQGVANYGTLLGSLVFGSSSDHLVLGAGSVTGTVAGGGGTVRLAGGGGDLTIGLNGGVSGSDSARFSGFGTYVIGAGGAWGAATFQLDASQRLVSEGLLNIVGQIDNAGLIEAALGGRVSVRANIVGGGVIEALPTSSVSIVGSVLAGGSLVTGGTGRISLGGGDFLDGSASAVSLQGRIALTADTTTSLRGQIDLAGQLTMLAASTLVVEGLVTLAGGGRVYLSNSAANLIRGRSSSDVLANASDRIQGAGDIGGGAMTLVNEAAGVIESFGAAGLTLDTGGTAVRNAGLLEADHANLAIVSALANSGKLEAVGATLTLEGAVTGAGSAAIFSGGAIVAQAAFSENLTFVGRTGSLSLAQSKATPPRSPASRPRARPRSTCAISVSSRRTRRASPAGC